jgi:hypothetical protein
LCEAGCEAGVFDGRVIMPDEIERIHKDLLQFERIEAFPMSCGPS